MNLRRILPLVCFAVINIQLVFSQAKVKRIDFDASVEHDSLIIKALSLSNTNRLRYNLTEQRNVNKCGLALQFEIQKNKKNLSKIDQALLDQILSRDIMDASILSSRGNFRIHYNKTGADAPNLSDVDNNGIPDFVDSTAYYFEYCLDKMVNTIGFENLLSDNNAGGGNEYDIYIKSLSSGTYGYTSFEETIETGAAPRYTSYITIDNDFNDLYTSGIDGLKITAGHELFHAIQIGRYGAWMDDIYYYEILSTWMETYLFPEVKDYYQYLHTFFTTTTKPFWKHSGYDLTVWGIYLNRKYSPSIMKSILEQFKNTSPVRATEKALNTVGSSFANEYAEFSTWIYFTSYRSKENYYFKNSKEYPLLSGSSLKLINYISPSCTMNAYLLPFTTQYFSIKYETDTISIISIRTNLDEAYNKADSYGSAAYQISGNISDPKAVSLTGNLKALFSTDNISDWKNFYLMNNNFIIPNEDVKVYPNPVIAGENSKIIFNIPASIGKDAHLFVFTSDLRLIYESKQQIKPVMGGNGIDWNCKDSNQKNISSGIYFYFVKAENKEWKNKFAVIRKK